MFDIADAKSVIAHITDSAVAVYTCPASRKAQITEFIVANKDGTNGCYLTGYTYVAAQDESSSGDDPDAYFAYQIEIPAKSAYTPFGESPSKWLSPGDVIYLQGEADGDLDLDMSVIEYYLPE